MLMFETGHFATLWRQIANRTRGRVRRRRLPRRADPKVEAELAEDKEQKTARSTRSRTRIRAARPACRGYPRHRERLESNSFAQPRRNFASLIGVLMPRPHAAGRFRASLSTSSTCRCPAWEALSAVFRRRAGGDAGRGRTLAS